MVRVKKSSKDFDKAKLKASTAKAGPKDADATEIVEKIAGKVRTGTTTMMIRRWVTTELTA